MLYVYKGGGRWEPDPPTGLNSFMWQMRWAFLTGAVGVSMLFGWWVG